MDRPESEWEWVDGEVTMGSAPLDPNAFIAQHLGGGAMPEAAVMGHVHLKVGNLEAAEQFYEDALGFAVTARSDGALFYSAGGYHHHLATNVWQSQGAETRSNPVGLGALTVQVPNSEALEAVATRLDEAGLSYDRGEGTLTTQDPWANAVNLVVQ